MVLGNEESLLHKYEFYFSIKWGDGRKRKGGRKRPVSSFLFKNNNLRLRTLHRGIQSGGEDEQQNKEE